MAIDFTQARTLVESEQVGSGRSYAEETINWFLALPQEEQQARQGLPVTAFGETRDGEPRTAQAIVTTLNSYALKHEHPIKAERNGDSEVVLSRVNGKRTKSGRGRKPKDESESAPDVT